MNFEELRDEITSNGGTLGPIEFVQTEEKGVGIFASEDIEEKTVVISIPFKICISAELISSTPPLNIIFEDNPQILNFPDEVLAIGLMFSSLNPDKDCAWKNHFKSLPAVVNNTLFWSEDELAELKDCTIFHLTLQMKKQILNDFESLHVPLSLNYPELLSFYFVFFNYIKTILNFLNNNNSNKLAISLAIKICKLNIINIKT
jgi:hypothetical protein